MTADRLLAVHSTAATSLYGGIPDLVGFRLRSLHLNWRGPTVTLRVDLPALPPHLPREWREEGIDTVQCHFQFLAVEDFSLTEWEPPVPSVTLTAVPLPVAERVEIRLTGEGVRASFSCNRSVLIGHFSGFVAPADRSDRGRHVFLGKLDRLRHRSVPEPEERIFFERL
ncbi:MULTISPECIES: Imm50 family immunity protein [unclassified Streptomyces]|uniref:Imm50 family immunity protein n=1 Tax=unclassified Streptomyces TaxID=2593676 RepID=UPI00367A40D5